MVTEELNDLELLNSTIDTPEKSGGTKSCLY